MRIWCGVSRMGFQLRTWIYCYVMWRCILDMNMSWGYNGSTVAIMDSNHHLMQRSWVLMELLKGADPFSHGNPWDGIETAWIGRPWGFPVESGHDWKCMLQVYGHCVLKWLQAIGYGYPIPKAFRRCFLQHSWYMGSLQGVSVFGNPSNNLALHNFPWHQ